MKKILAVLVALTMLLTVGVSFADDAAPIRVAAFSGPTGMGMAKLMSDSDAGAASQDYEFTIAGSPDQVTGPIAKGELDIACLPANLASVLYTSTEGGVTVLAVNTLGVIYILSHGETVDSVDDLAGMTLYASGKGSTPEYGLLHILNGNGMDPDTDLTIEWKSEHAEALAAFIANPDSAVMLPQPFVTAALGKAAGAVIALDLTAEWEALQEGAETVSSMITGVVIARTAFVEENPEAVEAFLAEYAASVAYTNENVAEAAQIIGSYGIVDAAVAEKAIPYCNIVCITGEELAEKLGGYLSVLFDQNPAAVGGAVPSEDFYYIAD